MKLIVATLIAAATVSAAHSQTVYRCGSTYSQLRCPLARIVEVDDQRGAAQQAEARRVADNERRLASDMRRERIADERTIRPAGAASLGGRAPDKVAVAVPERHRKKKPAAVKPQPTTDFVAYDPTSRKRRGN